MSKSSTRYTKPLTAYYATLASFEQQYALHEGAVSIAFHTLLADAGRSHHWTVIGQLSEKAAGKSIRPDGTLKDPMGLVRGHWEAKDTKDDLDVEIAKKTKAGYPLGNIIFEDTRTAVLIQHKEQQMRVDMKDPVQLAALLDAFFEYIEPRIESFEKAVDEFKERVPDIAKHLKQKIEEAHDGSAGPPRVQPNKKFNDAFKTFMDVCRTALNPNITQPVVDDMLVQHLLTERLIREIFDNPEFTRRNVIAAEIEKVIAALTSRSFDRNVFLKSLDRFYIAIENAARTITEWSDKQHFLNTIYERFFQGYNVKMADTMGIVYTPQPIVDFMCASVVEVLEKEFGKTLGDEGVNVLDPCTGTGNFIVNLLRRVPKKDLPRVYREQFFANEIMLLPYYIAALNIEHAYYEATGEYESFEGLCFVDTLDLAEPKQGEMSFMTAKNSERVERQKRTPITVVIGNPPYNFRQLNENDNNKNRPYPEVEAQIRNTYAKDSRATLRTALNDAYVKFFRYAVDRLGNADGIVCFVSNNSFIDQHAFDGFRKHLAQDFQLIYHVDLHGNVRQNPKLSGTTHNVFGIQVGVGITVAVKSKARHASTILYHRVPQAWRKEEKLAFLARVGSVEAPIWAPIEPDARFAWAATEHSDAFESFLPTGSKDDKSSENPRSIFHTYSGGIVTRRDAFVFDYDRSSLAARMGKFVEAYNSEVDRYRRAKEVKDLDSFVNPTHVKWDMALKSSLVAGRHGEFSDAFERACLYRPFTRVYVYFDRLFISAICLQHKFFPDQRIEKQNVVIGVSGPGNDVFYTLASNAITEAKYSNSTNGGSQCFPFYVYDEDGSNRRENITDWALEQYRTHYKDKTITKWDIFHYVYGLLHHPGYRTKFADNLKRELPRIPFAPDFRAFATAGEKLATLHLDYEKLEPWKLKWIETPEKPLSYRVEKNMKLVKPKAAKDVVAAKAADEAPPLFKSKRKRVGAASAAGDAPDDAKTAAKAAPTDEQGMCRLIVNESLTLGGIPLRALDYRLGNRSALEWVVDQYQVHTDPRSKIVSDPNRDDDEEYIVRLVGQVVRVSMETNDIVDALPAEFSERA
jgi:predicted helicase